MRLTQTVYTDVAARPPTDDISLMVGIRAKDASALAAFYDRYSPTVMALCIRSLRDAAEAEDVLEEVFWEVWERSDRYEPGRGAPATYLLRLARSRIIDRLRARRSRQRAEGGAAAAAPVGPLAGADDVGGPLDDADLAEQRASVTLALQGLPPEQRRVLEMAFFDAMSHSEIAQSLAEPLGTIKSRIRQALQRLRGSLQGFQ